MNGTDFISLLESQRVAMSDISSFYIIKICSNKHAQFSNYSLYY